MGYCYTFYNPEKDFEVIDSGKFVEASYSRELIDKINELINVVNELQEDYNTHLEAHKQNER